MRVFVTGATGWVDFFAGTQYLGTALINGGTASFNASGILPAGSYSVHSVLRFVGDGAGCGSALVGGRQSGRVG